MGVPPCCRYFRSDVAVLFRLYSGLGNTDCQSKKCTCKSLVTMFKSKKEHTSLDGGFVFRLCMKGKWTRQLLGLQEKENREGEKRAVMEYSEGVKSVK